MSSLYSHTVTAQAVQKVTLRNSERNPWCGIRCPKLTFVRLTRLKQSPFWKANSSSVSRKSLRILWNPKVHYPLPHSQQPATCSYPGSNQFSHSLLHLTPWISFLKLSSHLRLGIPCGLLPSGYPTKDLYAHIFSPIGAICPAHLIIIDFIIRIIRVFGLGYR